MKITQRNIAERCGVTTATVSMALRRDARISPVTTERVWAAAQELGYSPAQNQAARRMVMQRFGRKIINRVIALFLPPQFHRLAYYARIYQGIMDVVTEEQFALLITLFHEEMDATFRMPQVFNSGEVDGTIVYMGHHQPVLNDLHDNPGFRERPVCSLVLPLTGCSTVTFDDFHGQYAAVKHLLDLGHRNFLYLSFPRTRDRMEVFGPRLAGIHQALQEYHVPVLHCRVCETPMEWINPHRYSANEEQERRLLEVLQAHREITAILAHNDAMAHRVWVLLTQAGYRVPEDISLVGFDDTDPLPNASGVNQLTSVRLPLEDMGRASARHIIRQVLNGTNEVEHEVLPAELAIRRTTATACIP